MTAPPQKRASNFTASTANRGVEAREVEIANVHLDSGTQPSSRAGASPAPARRPPCAAARSPPSRDDSASYIQVLVQKQRRRRDAPRLARPSSPLLTPAPPPRPPPRRPSPPVGSTNFICSLEQLQRILQENGHPDMSGACAAGDTRAGAAGCPALALLYHSCGAAPAPAVTEGGAGAAAAPGPATCATRASPGRQKHNAGSLWQKVSSITGEDLDCADGPERLDVYRFERGGATLCARGPAPTRLERALRRAARPASRLLAELVAAPRALAALPAALLLLALRTALAPARDALVGLVQTLSDYALKPALALAFNALLQPALVCAAQAAHALREALRPLALALGDALEPAARLLAAVRLVHVERRCGCAHVA